jgi:hypothetical protein
MLIIADKRIPKEVKEKLAPMGDLCLLRTENIVYEAISCHPDIYIFQKNNSVIIAPQTPQNVISKLIEHNINYSFGKSILENKYPHTAAYNVAYGDGLFIGNKKTVDSKILELSKDNTWIQSSQSYARCNTLILNKNAIITSEITVHKKISSSLFINPSEIKLQGFAHGFFGGCAGIIDNKLIIIGSLNYHSQKNEIEEYCKAANFEIVELYDGPLIDGGGIFFLK